MKNLKLKMILSSTILLASTLGFAADTTTCMKVDKLAYSIPQIAYIVSNSKTGEEMTLEIEYYGHGSVDLARVALETGKTLCVTENAEGRPTKTEVK